MDCSLTEGLTKVGHDSSGKDSSGSDDDVPLSKLVTKPHSEKKQSREKSPTVGSKAKAKSASDDSSDDEPLIKKKRVPALEKKPQKKGNTPIRSNGTSNKKADVNTDDSSDNEPLIKIAKAAKKPISVPPKKAARAKKKKASDDSDDEPLSKLVNKRERKALVTPSKIASQDTKSRRNVATKKVKYAESSSDGSDDEPLAEMKKKLTNVPKKNSTDKKTKPKLKDKPPKDSSSSDSSSDEDEDDVPLVNLISKRKKPVKKPQRRQLCPEAVPQERDENLLMKARTTNL
nr:nucleolin 2-like [Labrus bergylta]